ncbi:hypothetical protein D9758_015154 [Tetrapyrgos nigripes]|uniref:LysM domain-containing protein n=1 Tax=Tetrapyrgos nigripes TaxID=182062 RepID=A0A8H5FQN6_9AGAR|nr:hypothetical protein D9758_015154 [Tetrapyrgos nigripes]
MAWTLATLKYTIKAGDYDKVISPKFGITVDWLYAANPGLDWDDLQISSYLNIPCTGTSTASSSAATLTTSSYQNYQIKAGDYNKIIAPKFGITIGQLYAANPGLGWDDMQISSYLNISCKATSTLSLSSATSSIVNMKTCSSLLITKITGALIATPNITITSIIGQIATTTSFMTALPTSLTISSGSNTVTQMTATTPTITTTSTSTIMTTFTVNKTVTFTSTSTPPARTTTVISYTFTRHRPSKSNLGNIYSDTPNLLKRFDLDNAKTA